MTWQQRYRFRERVASSLWLAPVLSCVLGLLCHRLMWALDLGSRWHLLGFSLDGARAILGSVSAAMLTFIIFLMSMILIALQIAVGQLTPRIIATAFRSWVIKAVLSVFMFTYLFSIAAQGRLADPVPQLVLASTIALTVVSTGAFLFLVDFLGKSLRPVSLCTRLAERGFGLAGRVYPELLASPTGEMPGAALAGWGEPDRVFSHDGKPGILAAFDAGALAQAAARAGCTLRLVPQVGGFVNAGDPLFKAYHGGSALDPMELKRSVAFQMERNPDEDLGQIFRVIVDIAIKALSPAINDPTTAVACLDHLQSLLARIGPRDLGDGRIRDAQGSVRLVYPVPAWEDYVRLAVSEIRDCGATSLQIVRRLRALLTDLLERMPAPRAAELLAQIRLLDEAVARAYADPAERELALTADHLGLGGAR